MFEQALSSIHYIGFNLACSKRKTAKLVTKYTKTYKRTKKLLSSNNEIKLNAFHDSLHLGSTFSYTFFASYNAKCIV